MTSRTKTFQEKPVSSPGKDAELHLMGATRLGEFLQFVRQRAIGGRERDECEVADLWRAAAKHYESLQTTQINAANHPKVLPLPKSMQAHVERLTAQESFRATFATVPIAFGMVPLAQLVCSQFDLTVSTLNALKKRIPKKLSPKALIDLCLPLAPGHGHCVTGREASGEYVFHSDSHDLRSFSAQLMPVSSIAGYRPRGHAQAAIVVGVGFSTNVLNVVRYANRMVLNNGYHRAMTLVSLGYTHAPCVIQVCSQGDDLGQCAMREINQNYNLYFTQSRPPLLRDYLEPALTSQWDVNPVRRQVTIKLTYETRDIAQTDVM
jgi:hypothetical protein